MEHLCFLFGQQRLTLIVTSQSIPSATDGLVGLAAEELGNDYKESLEERMESKAPVGVQVSVHGAEKLEAIHGVWSKRFQ